MNFEITPSCKSCWYDERKGSVMVSPVVENQCSKSQWQVRGYVFYWADLLLALEAELPGTF